MYIITISVSHDISTFLIACVHKICAVVSYGFTLYFSRGYFIQGVRSSVAYLANELVHFQSSAFEMVFAFGLKEVSLSVYSGPLLFPIVA